MVSKVPTFNATSTIQTGGIVSFNGTRQMNEGLQSMGNVFNKLGDYHDKVLARESEFKQNQAGINLGMSQGFKPQDMKDPKTAADYTLRQAAFNAYGQKLETDIEDKLNDFQLKYNRNPAGFANAAQAYIGKTVEDLPPELKQGASKLANSIATRKHFGMAQEMQRIVLAESAEADKIRIESLSDKIALSKDDAEKQLLMGQLAATVSNSTAYVTAEGKQAALTQATKDVVFNSNYQLVARGEKSPTEAIEALAASGIAIDSSKLGQFYGAYNAKMSFEQNQQEMKETGRKAEVDRVVDDGLLQLWDLQQSDDPDDVKSYKRDLLTQSLKKNARLQGANVEELVNLDKSFIEVSYSKTASADFVADIEQRINTIDPNAERMLSQGLRSGLVDKATYVDLSNKLVSERSSIANNPIVQDYINNDFMPKYAPNAVYGKGGEDISYITSNQMKASIEADKAALQGKLQRIQELTIGKEGVPPMPVDKAVQLVRQETLANDSLRVTGKIVSGDGAVEANVLAQQVEFPMKKFNPATGKMTIEKMPRLTPENAPLYVMEISNQRKLAANRGENPNDVMPRETLLRLMEKFNVKGGE